MMSRVLPSSGIGLMEEHTSPLGASAEGVGQGHSQRVLGHVICHRSEIIY